MTTDPFAWTQSTKLADARFVHEVPDSVWLITPDVLVYAGERWMCAPGTFCRELVDTMMSMGRVLQVRRSHNHIYWEWRGKWPLDETWEGWEFIVFSVPKNQRERVDRLIAADATLERAVESTVDRFEGLRQRRVAAE